MTRNNTTFGRGAPTWANACVGDNGSPNYWDYAKGFSQAANLLLDQVLRDGGVSLSVDELIYPVCFNMRHSVELRLKGAISELIALEQYRNRRLDFDLAGSHDIGNIWAFFSQNSARIDNRYASINTRLNTKIIDIAEIDATGQTFRYPFDTDSQKHLVDVEIINFVRLRSSFSELEKALDDLHNLNNHLRVEYSFGSFTRSLSRKDIFDVASQLPNRSCWSEEPFEETRETIKRQFNLTNSELSKSIKIIEKHFELAPVIGCSVALLGASERDVATFVKLWFKLHDLPDDTATSAVIGSSELGLEEMLEGMVRSEQVCRNVWEEISPKLTAEMLAGLSALFYFGRDLDFSERYILIFERHLREAKIAFESSDDSVKAHFFHIFNKPNALYNILRSLYFIKKSEFAEELVSEYDLGRKFSWLDDARNRVIFRKLKHWGYAT
ncbi:MAG: hypothetical protein QM776_13995 [Rhodocyclaceae bacterium]